MVNAFCEECDKDKVERFFLEFIINEYFSSQTINFFGSPWSPPAWMKGNNDMYGSSTPCLKTESKYQDAWARYMSKWITTWNDEGIPIWGVTVQNEPEYAPPTEGCLYTAEQQRDFVRDYLGKFSLLYPKLTSKRTYSERRPSLS